MKINTLSLIEGAKKASGLTVIIDVFRAFSLECYLSEMGAAKICPVGTIEESFLRKQKDPACILIGERHGKMCEGFDFGNSPFQVDPKRIKGSTVIHNTSAGTQGVINAVNATKIIGGSLVNAKAVAAYILKEDPEEVSLVCMGNGGVRPAPEDELCAEYIKSLLENKPVPDMDKRTDALKEHGGKHFFNPDTQDVFPEEDFFLCTRLDISDFVLLIEKDAEGFVSKRIDVK